MTDLYRRLIGRHETRRRIVDLLRADPLAVGRFLAVDTSRREATRR